jgi:hypothetical protein
MNVSPKHATRSLFVLTLITFLITSAAQSQTLYSRKTPANWNDVTVGNGAWSTSAGGPSCDCYPGDATHTAVLGWSAIVASGHTITLPSTAFTPNSIINLTVNGTLLFGTNGGTGKTLTMTGDVTVATGGILRSGNTGATAHTIQIGGDLINNGTFDQTFNSPTNQTVTFNSPTAARTIRGTSNTITFYNMNVATLIGSLSFGDNTATTRTLNVTNDLTIATAAASLQSGNTGAVAHTIQLGGTLTNNGTINLTANSATNHAITFNGAAAESILGSATTAYTFYNMNVTGAGALSFVTMPTREL